MIVTITADAVALVDPDDVGRFHVAVAAGVTGVDAALQASGFGRLDSDTEALISVDALRRAAAGSVGPDWAERFAGMLTYADTKGWLAEGGTAIRGHLEPG